MKYPLESMLTIRVKREDRAALALTKARQARVLAEKERDEKQRKLDDFNSTKEERRDKIYDTVMGRVVKMNDLDEVRDAVAVIDEEGILLDEARSKAQEQLENRISEVETARIGYVAASKNKMKIEQHKQIWTEEDFREQERLEDLELEEFTGKKVEIQ